jgi:hypothetical protein
MRKMLTNTDRIFSKVYPKVDPPPPESGGSRFGRGGVSPGRWGFGGGSPKPAGGGGRGGGAPPY